MERAPLDSLSLVRSCIHKAVGLLRDTNGAASRSMQRINILLTLLQTGESRTGGEQSSFPTSGTNARKNVLSVPDWDLINADSALYYRSLSGGVVT